MLIYFLSPSCQMNSISICTWNVNGIRKLHQFFSRSRKTVQAPDILCLQETWAASSTEQLSIHDYVSFHANAQPSLGPRPVGGVSTYLKMETFKSGRLVRIVTPVWWALTVRWIREDGPGLLVINVYTARHTQGVDASEFETFFEFVEDLRAENGADRVLIAGDMNVDRFRRPRPTVREERILAEWLTKMEAEQFKIFPDRPVVTYLDAGTTLDYVLASEGLQPTPDGWRIEEAVNCQHLPLLVNLKLDDAGCVGQSMEVCARNLKFYPGSVLSVRELLLTCLSDISGHPSVEHVYDTMLQSFYVYGHESSTIPTSDGSSWWRYVPANLQQELHELESDAKFLAREWSEGRRVYTTGEVVSFRRELNRVSALCRGLAETAILQEMRSQFPNQGLCWKVLRKLRSPESSVAIDIGTLQQHFTRIFHRRDRPVFVDVHPQEGWGRTRPGERHFDEPFTDRELKRALKELNGQAGTGPERVPSQAIKDVFADEQVRPILLLLMNICFQEGVLPTAWGLAELFVLFKGKGLPTVADNYRAIALSNDFRRVYERLVQARLNSWSVMNNSTGSLQFGFKAGTGTIEAIFVLRTFMLYVTRCLKVPGFAIFIDMKKAFPSVSRVKIVEVLRRKSAPWKVTRAVASLLSGSIQRLRVNGKLTDIFPVTSGTPEGSINSPELFAVVYRDLLEELDIHELPEDLSQVERGKVYYIIFADDLSFFSLDIEPLQDRVIAFKVRAVAYDMALNAAKSKWMAFLPEDAPEEQLDVSRWKIVIDDDVVENVDEFVYLGFCLDVMLNDEAHVKMINDRYIKAARATGRLMNELRCVNLANLRQFFLSLVFSQLYGLMFVDEDKVEFERGVGIFLKSSLGLPDSFPHTVAMACLGVKHVKIFQFEQRVKFLSRWEQGEKYPVFDMLFCDRAHLFPLGSGLNGRFGKVLANLGLLVTIDFTANYRSIHEALTLALSAEHRGRLLSAEGRALWTELGSDGYLSIQLKQVLSDLCHESLRIVIMFFADMLCWSSLKQPSRKCPTCSGKFTSAHFFTCSQFFSNEHGWNILVNFCRAEAWTDLIDYIFHILQKWVVSTPLFRDSFKIAVLEYEPLCGDIVHAAFRWNV